MAERISIEAEMRDCIDLGKPGLDRFLRKAAEALKGRK